MSLLADRLKRFKSGRGAWWEAFDVSFDGEHVVVVEQRRSEVTEERFCWSSVRRVCFEDRGLSSDVFYVFTSERPEAFMIPVEASGGNALWDALRQRGLFPEPVSAAAVRSTDGGLYCWPDEGAEDASANWPVQPTGTHAPRG